MVVVQRLRPLLSRRLLGDLEIDLALEVVHFGDLHLDVVAELENAAGAAANEVGASGVEEVKVIADFVSKDGNFLNHLNLKGNLAAPKRDRPLT